jgi:hypothetical protein
MDKKDEVKYYVTKAGIKIGNYYERKPLIDLTYDMELVQSAMLNDQGYLRKEKIKNLTVMLAVCGAIFLLMLITKD